MKAAHLLRLAFFAGALSLVLVGCGGGGGSAKSKKAPSTDTQTSGSKSETPGFAGSEKASEVPAAQRSSSMAVYVSKADGEFPPSLPIK